MRWSASTAVRGEAWSSRSRPRSTISSGMPTGARRCTVRPCSATMLPQLLAQDTVRAAQVEDAAGGTIAEPGEYAPVGAAGVDLELVGLARERQLARAQPHAVEPVPRRVDEDIPGVRQPVDVTDLVAVIGGDGDLADPP